MSDILHNFGKYVSFNVMAMIGLSCYILADTFFVSAGLGTNGLTALNLAIPVYSFINGSGLLIGIGGATKYAIDRAKSDNESANRTFTHAMLLGVIISLLFVLIGVFFVRPLCMLLGSDSVTFSMTYTYIKTLLFFAPMFLCNNILIAFIRNDGAPDLAMAAMLTGSISNIVLDYVFIFPCGLGIFGAAFATGLAPVISMILLSVHFIKRKNHFRLIRTKVIFSYFPSVCLPGIASFITEAAAGLVMILFNIVILNLSGNIGVAAYGIVANLALVATAIFTGIAQGIQPLLSSNYGTGHTSNVTRVYRYAIRTGCICFAAIYSLVFLFAPQIVSIFNSEQNVTLTNLAIHGLRVYFIGFLFCGISIITSSFFSSTEKPFYALLISLLRGAIFMIPSLLIISSFAGMNGVWAAYPVCECLTFAVTAVLYFRKRSRVL